MTTMTFSPTMPRVTVADASARRSSLRLTRRGRAAVFLAGLIIAVIAGFVLANGSTATLRAESLTTIQVGPGETLWGIASSVAVDGHTSDMVEHIKELNDLQTAALAVGQELRVPMGN